MSSVTVHPSSNARNLAKLEEWFINSMYQNCPKTLTVLQLVTGFSGPHENPRFITFYAKPRRLILSLTL